MKIYRIAQWRNKQVNEVNEVNEDDKINIEDWNGENGHYTYIGHDPAPSKPVILWIIKPNGEILTSKTTNNKDYHGNQFPNTLNNAIAQGRYDTFGRMCSISYTPEAKKYHTSRAWVKSLLKEKFPSAAFVEYNIHYCNSFSITNILKTSQIQNKQKIVSFDFDNTIFILDWDDENGYYKFDPKDPETPTGHINQSIVNLINQHNSQGWKCICVTSRSQNESKQVNKVIMDNSLPINEIYFTNGQDKVFKLKELGVSKHYDDDPIEIQYLKNSGIEGIKV